MLISSKNMERVLNKLKNGKCSQDQITGDVLNIAHGMSGKAVEIVVDDVLG